MKQIFDVFFNRLISTEGGYVNDPADPGGETKWGISHRSYPTLSIKNLTREQAKEIYRKDFWERGQMDQLPSAIAFQVFDIAANSGIETAIRMLQRAIEVADDGYVGPVTLAAVHARSQTDVIVRLIAERLDFWRRLSAWSKFGKGWAGRAADTLRAAAIDT